MNTEQIDYIRRQAITVFELTKGFTPEQRQNLSNELNSLEGISGYVLELTDELKQLKEALKEILPIAAYYHNAGIMYTEMPYKNWNDSIHKARKLLTK